MHKLYSDGGRSEEEWSWSEFLVKCVPDTEWTSWNMTRGIRNALSSTIYYLSSNIFRGMGENTFQLCTYILASKWKVSTSFQDSGKGWKLCWMEQEKDPTGPEVFPINLLHDFGRITSSFFLCLFLHLRTWDGDGFFFVKCCAISGTKTWFWVGGQKIEKNCPDFFFFKITMCWPYHRVK